MAKNLGSEEKPKKGAKAAPDPDRSANVSQDTFLESVQELAGINAKMKACNEERKRIRKTIKARGLELGVLDATLKMAEWDRDEVRANFDNRRKYAEWLGLPIGVQAELFEGMKAEEKAFAEWQAKGKTSRLAGKPAQPPEDCPETYQLAWTRGWKIADGQTPPDLPKPAKVEGKAKKNDAGEIIAPKRTPEEEAEFERKAEAKAKRKRETDAALQ